MTFATILHLSTSLMMAAPLIMVWWTFRPAPTSTSNSSPSEKAEDVEPLEPDGECYRGGEYASALAEDQARIQRELK